MKFNISPVAKPRMTRRDKWLDPPRPCVAKYRAFQNELLRQVAIVGFELPSEYKITFFVPMPKSWSQKKRNKMRGMPHQQRPDLDNLIKAFQDALLDNDSFIWHVDKKKLWGDVGYIEVEFFQPTFLAYMSSISNNCPSDGHWYIYKMTE